MVKGLFLVVDKVILVVEKAERMGRVNDEMYSKSRCDLY